MFRYVRLKLKNKSQKKFYLSKAFQHIVSSLGYNTILLYHTCCFTSLSNMRFSQRPSNSSKNKKEY